MRGSTKPSVSTLPRRRPPTSSRPSRRIPMLPPVGQVNGATSGVTMASSATMPAPPALSSCGRIVVGSASDHHSVYELLQRAFRAPSADAFSASLEEPLYEPCHRLVIRHGERLIGHVLLSERTMLLGTQAAAVTNVSWLAAMPELRGRGLGRSLLAAADERIVQQGSLLGVLKTRQPQFFAKAGWTPCGRVSRYVAGARPLLAHTTQHNNAVKNHAAKNHAAKNHAVSKNGANNNGANNNGSNSARPCIRPWRHVELSALVRLYAANLTPGMFERNEASWRWLIGRRAYDQIYVATDAGGRCHLEDNGASLVGYVITKGNDVLELMADPTRPEVAWQLLERVCGDAIEMNCHHLGMFTPPQQHLGDIFLAVGGQRQSHTEPDCEYLMAKLPSPLAVAQWLAPQLQQRAAAAGLSRGELSLLGGATRLTMTLSRRGVKVVEGAASRNQLRCSAADLTRLLLGASQVEHLAAEGRAEVSSRAACQLAAALFPKLPLWRAPLDDLME